MQLSASFRVRSDEVNDLPADGVAPAHEIGGGALLSRDRMLGLTELLARANAQTIHTCWPTIDEDRAWTMLSETSTDSHVTWHMNVRINTTFETDQLRTCVADVDTSSAPSATS